MSTTKTAPFRKGDLVRSKITPQICSRVRSIAWVDDCNYDLDTGKPQGAFIVNLEDGNYGGSDCFQLEAAK